MTTLTPGSIKVGRDRHAESIHAALTDAIAIRAGGDLAGGGQIARFSRNRLPMTTRRDGRITLHRRPIHQRAAEFAHITSVIEMGRQYLIALGHRPAASLSKPALAALLMSRTRLQGAIPKIYLAHSTGDFPGILADVMNKQMRAAYALAQPSWPLWARRVTAPDLKEIKRVQIGGAADLKPMNEGDEFEYGKLEETSEVYALGKFGQALKFTREMLINDDLRAFREPARRLGRAAQQLEESTAVNVLTANPTMGDGNALFSAAHNNIADADVTVAGMSIGRAMMRTQTEPGSTEPLELTPAVALFPEELITAGEQLIASTVDPARSNDTPNPQFIQRMTPASSARLSNDSADLWYLFANNSQIDTVEVCFLEGEEQPQIEEDNEFDDDTMKLKISHYVAAKAIDFRGMARLQVI